MKHIKLFENFLNESVNPTTKFNNPLFLTAKQIAETLNSYYNNRIDDDEKVNVKKVNVKILLDMLTDDLCQKYALEYFKLDNNNEDIYDDELTDLLIKYLKKLKLIK